MCQDFFRKKDVFPAIKRKRDALFVMKALRKTPRNAAGTSYEAGRALEHRKNPEKRMTVMRRKQKPTETTLQHSTTQT